ncbi:MAG: tyrosine-type recombinase/integrase [Eubacteriales bacterium]|nr:tyrosine-type recombinase/integrase [Eubacteriales bacterium]
MQGLMPQPQETGCHRLSYYCDEWLKSERIKVKESTFVRYETIVERHIKPRLGGQYPLSIRENLVDSFTQKLLCEDELSAKTVKDILVALRSILKYTARQFPGIFPEIQFSYPKESKQFIRVLSIEEQVNLCSYLLCNMDLCKFGVMLALYTGLRIGELCALQWKDISGKDCLISVNATVQRIKDIDAGSHSQTKITIGEPKSDCSTRQIPMTDFIAELCERMRPENSAAFILTGTEKCMEPRTLQYRLAKYTKECGLDGVHFHTLRHTFATRCIEVGFEIKSLSEILGHASTTITLNRYVHSSMELKRDNMKKLAAASILK